MLGVLRTGEEQAFNLLLGFPTPISPYKKPHNTVIISCMPRLGSSTTILTYSPALRPFATCGFSWPCGSAPPWPPPPLLPFFSLTLQKPLVPPFPPTAQSWALAFTDQLEWVEGSCEMPCDWRLVGATSLEEVELLSVQTASEQPITFILELFPFAVLQVKRQLANILTKYKEVWTKHLDSVP